MSEVSATPNLHNNLPLQAHDSRVGLEATSTNSARQLQATSVHTALFQAPVASESTMLDVQPAVGMPADADTHAKHIIAFVGSR